MKNLCGCGCGQEIASFDNRGRSRKFISGHNAKRYTLPSNPKLNRGKHLTIIEKGLSSPKDRVTALLELKERVSKGIIYFIECLKHPKGKWSGKPFILAKWEREVIEDIFLSNLNADGTRKIRTAYLSLGRKNGKSHLGAAIGLWMLFGDGESGAEIYSCAGDEKQAMIIFRLATDFIKLDPILSKVAKITPSELTIEYPETLSFYRVVSSEADTKLGLNASCILADELAIWRGRSLWEVMQGSMLTRIQPLFLSLTTAGSDKESLCYEIYDMAKRIEKGIIPHREDFYFKIYELGEADSWRDETVWIKSNPALGDYIPLKNLQQKFQTALTLPRDQAAFRRYYCNQWISEGSKWIPLESWDKCSDPIPLDTLTDRPCFCGLDLSSSRDLSSLCLCFLPGEDGIYDFIWYHYMPEERVKEFEETEKLPFREWIEDGFITAVQGNYIDHSVIKDKLISLKEMGIQIKSIGIDPRHAIQLSAQLTSEGFEVVALVQSSKTLSEPLKRLGEMILSQKMRHGNNPLLRYMLDNIVVKEDSYENIYLSKKRNRARIDGIFSAIMALNRAEIHVIEPEFKFELGAVNLFGGGEED
jgi:phage terminase large subunit-like protein